MHVNLLAAVAALFANVLRGRSADSEKMLRVIGHKRGAGRQSVLSDRCMRSRSKYIPAEGSHIPGGLRREYAKEQEKE
ncbi:MAG TPA: hypothetical protein VKA19_03040 [Alphaproteobacteria bacterium]|nr:hypothetical protein [Alphaproteobacteria bacterium]